MKLEDAINLLKRHQEWRLGGEGELIYPKELTQAIDIVINEFTLIKKEMTAKEKSKSSKLQVRRRKLLFKFFVIPIALLRRHKSYLSLIKSRTTLNCKWMMVSGSYSIFLQEAPNTKDFCKMINITASANSLTLTNHIMKAIGKMAKLQVMELFINSMAL